MIDTKITEQDRNISRIKINLGIGDLAITIHDHLQHHDKILALQISENNFDQYHPTLQYLPGFEAETRATVYHRTRNSHFPTMVTSQT